MELGASWTESCLRQTANGIREDLCRRMNYFQQVIQLI